MSTKKESNELNQEQLAQMSEGHNSGECAPKKDDDELTDELKNIVGGHDSGEYAPRNDGGGLPDATKNLFESQSDYLKSLERTQQNS